MVTPLWKNVDDAKLQVRSPVDESSSTTKCKTAVRILGRGLFLNADHSEGNTTEPPDVLWLSGITFAMISKSTSKGRHYSCFWLVVRTLWSASGHLVLNV